MIIQTFIAAHIIPTVIVTILGVLFLAYAVYLYFKKSKIVIDTTVTPFIVVEAPINAIPDAVAPVVTPEVVTPEVVTPEVVTPEVVTPEVVVPVVGVTNHGPKIDLSVWKLSIPVAKGSGVVEIKNPVLQEGYEDEYFIPLSDGSIVMNCPTNGGTTQNSHNPRTELREMLPTGEWGFSGTHILDVECKITSFPPSQKGIIIGQIHGTDSDLNPQVCKLYWKPTNLVIAELKTPKGDYIRLPMGSIKVGDRVRFTITMKDKELLVVLTNLDDGTSTVKGTSSFIDPYWDKQKYYFKAGNYLQVNTTTPIVSSSMIYYKINVAHS